MILVRALAGLFAGVLVNALADSLPTARAVRRPSCSSCGAPRPRVGWSGLSAWITGNSHCPYCNAPQSARRPIVEVLSVAWSVVLSLIVPGPGLYWPSFLLSTIMLLVIVIDLEHRLILHVVTGPAAIVMGLLGSLDASRGPVKTVLGGAVGFLVVLGLFLLGGLFARLICRVRADPR